MAWVFGRQQSGCVSGRLLSNNHGGSGLVRSNVLAGDRIIKILVGRSLSLLLLGMIMLLVLGQPPKLVVLRRRTVTVGVRRCSKEDTTTSGNARLGGGTSSRWSVIQIQQQRTIHPRAGTRASCCSIIIGGSLLTVTVRQSVCSSASCEICTFTEIVRSANN